MTRIGRILGVDLYAEGAPERVKIVQRLIGRALNPDQHYDYDEETGTFTPREVKPK